MSGLEGSDPGVSGTHTCGGNVTNGACDGCGADGIASSNVKGAR